MYSRGIRRKIDDDTGISTVDIDVANGIDKADKHVAKKPRLIRFMKDIASNAEDSSDLYASNDDTADTCSSNDTGDTCSSNDDTADTDTDYGGERLRHVRNRAAEYVGEEARLRKLMGVTDVSLKTQILNCSQPDLVKVKCLQYLQLYEDDPENNSTSLTALQLILNLPTKCIDSVITTKKTHEEITQFLSTAWNYMEEQVYGQEPAKSEIIGYLVSRLVTNKPRVLGLVGPPGVGKTSLAIHGISRAIGVPFYHISIGGLKDVTYFNGSFRCYKGSRQGIFTDILIKEQCLDPIIYIDELDKISVETAQEVYGILTHATDPLTNKHIQDYFLGIDLDLSKATFIFSYNDVSAVPEPLRDRIKEIHLGGFNSAEKIQLAQNFIIPSCLKEYGVSSKDIIFTKDVISHVNGRLAEQYAHIPEGVRYLNQGYQSLVGKLIVNIIGDKTSYLQYLNVSTSPEAPLLDTTIKQSPRRARTTRTTKAASVPKFAPYFRQISLPYNVCVADIDFYMR